MTYPRKEVWRVFQDDLRSIPGLGWLPHRWVERQQEGGRTKRVVIREAKFEKPPSSTFSLDFQEAFRLMDQSRDLSYPARDRWSLLDLPGANTAGTKVSKVAEFRLPAPVMPGEQARGANWPMVLLALGAILLVLGLLRAFLVARNRR
jgi:hypothetical protein